MLYRDNEKSDDHVWRINKATFPRPLATETCGLEIYRRKSKNAREVLEENKTTKLIFAQKIYHMWYSNIHMIFLIYYFPLCVVLSWEVKSIPSSPFPPFHYINIVLGNSSRQHNRLPYKKYFNLPVSGRVCKHNCDYRKWQTIVEGRMSTLY